LGANSITAGPDLSEVEGPVLFLAPLADL
jgi:hypothetical protein